MKHFSEILEALGASSITLVHENADWDFWSAQYRTPVAVNTGYYLYLKHRCPQKVASSENLSKWSQWSQSSGYNVILTPKSALANSLKNTQQLFRASSISTTHEILLNNLLKDLSFRPTESEEYFLDPDIMLPTGKIMPEATKYLSDWMSGTSSTDDSSGLSILVADGGVGKTTVARIVSTMLRNTNSHLIPILIESEQWHNLLETNSTLESVFDLALRRRFEQASRFRSNPTAFQVLVREGLFIIIFDGFDELCVYPNGRFRPKDIIVELQKLTLPEDGAMQARVLLTCRKTFWESISEEVADENLTVLQLRGFDNEQRKRYFQRRLGNIEERDIANRLAKQISGAIYDGLPREAINEDRPSGVPFILDLIARYVHDNPEAQVNAYAADPLEDLLEGICRRENMRQNLSLDAGRQMAFFEELFREESEAVTQERLAEYLYLMFDIEDAGIVQRFTNHAFLIRHGQNVYGARYEVLRVYFLARFLANSLLQVTQGRNRREIAALLAENSTGKTQVMDWLMRQLDRYTPDQLRAAINHAFDIIDDKDNQSIRKFSSLALFHLVNKLVRDTDKSLRVRHWGQLLNAASSKDMLIMRRRVCGGQLRALDLSQVYFTKCEFIDMEFKNCIFGAQTVFEDCIFEGTLAFVSCESLSSISTKGCRFSDESEYAMNEAVGKQTSVTSRKKFAEDALHRALKKFRGEYGWIGIQYNYRKPGFKRGNPYNDIIWDCLEEERITERHHISNVDDGGIHIVDDRELRREVVAFLDNAVLGRRLRKLIEGLVGS